MRIELTGLVIAEIVHDISIRKGSVARIKELIESLTGEGATEFAILDRNPNGRFNICRSLLKDKFPYISNMEHTQIPNEILNGIYFVDIDKYPSPEEPTFFN